MNKYQHTWRPGHLGTALLVMLLSPFALWAQSGTQATTIANRASADAIGDSLLRSYSIDELIAYRDYYEEERDRLETERATLRKRGIQDLEAFLRNHPESRVLDKVVFRLAELYYEQAEEDYFVLQERYGEQLDAFDAGQLETPPAEPKKDFSRALALYNQIDEQYPASPLLDDANYNLAFIAENLGQKTEALAIYERFPKDFPDSKYLPDVLLRQAEYYFNPPINALDKAIDIYKKVLKFPESPRYDEALYRLGWCYYRMSDYPKAISYFTTLADDIEKARELDPQNRVSNPSLADESIEYIGISFLDYSGVQGAAEYLERIGGRRYGFDVLKKIGDAYMDVKEEHESAVEAYNVLLRMYPYAPDAPRVQAKIAEAYRRMENDAQAYFMRKKLYADYNQNSEWWKQVENEESRKQAYRLAEHGLRANINLLLDSARENKDKNLFAQAVDDSRDYLTAFPQDSNAARIHWNMALTLDTQLGWSERAYDEYLKISNLYWQTKFQLEAATNAIAIAQEFVDADAAPRDSIMALRIGEIRERAQRDSSGLRKTLALEPQPLTTGEEKLIVAIDNYIKLFPFESETAPRLSQAGSIYYNRNDFANSLKYFKTFLRHFNEDSAATQVEYLVMESYFGRLDYRSVEIVAKRLKARQDERYLAQANKRLAEAIFLMAEAFADSANHFKAAEEYRRVAEEVPDAEFADLALFNSGLEYDKAGEYSRAVEIYQVLVDNYASSTHYMDALNNMALDYGELRDFRNAAIIFERLASEEADSAKAETHLYNASFFYVKNEDWDRAIRVNKRFVERYPDSEDADDMYYDIANYYLKLDKFEEANTIYGEYAERFPDSPRVVETYFRRGEFFEKKGRLSEARQEFQQAVSKSDSFRERNMESNDFFAAEALFRLAELRYQEFAGIRFVQPPSVLQANIDKKRAMLLQLVDDYTRVAGFGTIRLYESTFKVAAAYENFATAWTEQELPSADASKQIVARKEINETGSELYERAVDAYKNNISALTRISSKYQEATTDSAGGKVSALDSTRLVADRFISQSKVKVSENIYRIAEINSASVSGLLEAPLPENIDLLTLIEYRNQLIGKFVRPIVTDIVSAHVRNLQEARELQLDNKWVDLSRNKIVSNNAVIAREYARLSWDGIGGLDGKFEDYVRTLPDDEVIATGISDDIANYIEFSRSFAKVTITAFQQTIEKAQEEQINNYELLKVENDLLEFVHQFSLRTDSLAGIFNVQRGQYEQKFNTSGEPMYEEGTFAMEDAYLSLAESHKEILGLGYEVAHQLKLENQYTDRIILALVRSEPGKYAGVLGLDISEMVVKSDRSWLMTTAADSGWMALDHADSGWQRAAAVDSAAAFPGYGAMRLWIPAEASTPTLADPAADPDSTATPEVEPVRTHPATVYFRKVIEIDGLPVAGQIQLFADDRYAFYVNGELIARQQFEPGNTQAGVHNFTDFLVPGKNVIAIKADDSDASGGGIESLLFVKKLPGWEKRQQELRQQKLRERENLLFDKGILVKAAQ